MINEQVIDIYEKSIRQLPVADRLRLLAMIAEGLVSDCRSVESPPKRDIMDFRGIAKGAWDGIDAQDYVNQLRDEWEKPSK